jgi:sigma-E factor negative regulatory protein RseC
MEAVMTQPGHTVEGIARVVRVDAGVAWFEPEQTTSCGHCASSAVCGTGSGGIGSVASRIELRRFSLDNTAGLRVGERVVVGVDERALLKAALTAYALPLATALAAGGIAQGLFGDDLATMGAMAFGLGLGLLAARFAARRLSARGELSPRFLRRAAPGETCGTNRES